MVHSFQNYVISGTLFLESLTFFKIFLHKLDFWLNNKCIFKKGLFVINDYFFWFKGFLMNNNRFYQLLDKITDL